MTEKTHVTASAIRHLGSGDIKLMRGLLTLFGEVFAEPATYCDNQPSDAYLAKLLARDDFIALAALDGDRVAGGLAAYELKKCEQECSEIYIYDLAVAETHRRRGIATALITGLKKIARARDASVIFVQADEGDTAPIALYDKLGRRERVLHFDIKVE